MLRFLVMIRLCVAAALGAVIASCSGCNGWSSAPPNSKRHDDQQHAREQAEDLRRWLENPVAELQDIDGSCVSWLDSTSCNYTFKALAPVRFRNPRLKHVRCEDIEGLTGEAKQLGFDRVAANQRDHTECFFRGGRISDGGYVLVLHDKVTQRYGIRDVNSPP
jgi:hypothetical protein